MSLGHQSLRAVLTRLLAKLAIGCVVFLCIQARAAEAVGTNEIVELNRRCIQLHEQSRWTEAMPVAERLANLIVERDGENSTNAAEAIHVWAWLVQENGDHDKAEELWLRALRIDEKLFGKDTLRTSRRMHLLANCYRDQGHHEKAAPLLQQALAIREEQLGPDHPDTAQILDSLGVLDERMGNFAGAEANFLRALPIFEKQGIHAARKVGGILSALGWLYGAMGDYERRAMFIRQSVDFRKKIYGSEHIYTASGIHELALVHRADGELDKAVGLLRESLALREKLLGTNHVSLAEVVLDLGTIRLSQGDWTEAAFQIERARGILEENLGAEHPRFANALLTLATLEEKRGNYTAARELCEQAYAINENRYGIMHRATLWCQRRLAWLDVAEGRADRALARADGLQQGEENLLANVLSFTSERQRLAYQRTSYLTRDSYDLWASLGAEKPLARAILRTKGVVLDSLIEDRLLADAAADPEVRELVAQITRARRGEAKPMIPISNHSMQRVWPSEIERLEALLARRVSGIGQTRRVLSVELEQVLSAIPKDAVVLEMIRYRHRDGKQREEKYGALILLRGENPKWVCLGTARTIERSIKLYQHAVRTPNAADLDRLLRDLYDQFVPLLRELPSGVKRLIVSPDGELNFISFATLLAPTGRFLGEDYSVSYVSSGRDLLGQNDQNSRTSQLAVWANPDFSGTAEKVYCAESGGDLNGSSFPPLPGAEKEGRKLHAMAREIGFTNVVLYVGTEATEVRLQDLRSPNVLHLATHGFLLPNVAPPMEDEDYSDNVTYAPNPMLRVGLALVGARRTMQSRAQGKAIPAENDGLVTADEIACLRLRGTRLVVLSACDTGAGEARVGEGVLGLRRGFIQAGAENLLLTLWPLDDRGTDGFMVDFYTAMYRGGSPARALAEVQRTWLCRLRREKGAGEACRLAGPFIMSFQGNVEEF